MRKTKLLLLALTLCFTTSVWAQNVSETEALSRVTSFVKSPSRASLLGLKKSKASSATISLATKATDGSYYVFNVGTTGFVVASGYDATAPILGYSDAGAFNETNAPEALKSLLQSYQTTIALARKSGQTVKAAATHTTDISPLVQTQWAQGAPFNNKCPDGTLTGCVATAMAQILYTLHSADKTAAASSTAIKGYSWNGSQLADLEATTFDYDDMLTAYGSDATEAQQTAVATLMQYCGWGLRMSYSTSFSGAFVTSVPEALSYFGMQGTNVTRAEYTTKTWDGMIYDELSAGRPVLYGGSRFNSATNTTGGHAYVLDGYQLTDGVGYYHVNWGWANGSDGYFLLDVLNGYSLGQAAVVGISKTGTSISIASKDATGAGTSSYTVNSVTFPEKTVVNVAAKVKANITNNSTNVFYSECFMKTGSTDGTPVDLRGVFIGPGETGDVEFSIQPTEAGETTYYFVGNGFDNATATNTAVYAVEGTATAPEQVYTNEQVNVTFNYTRNVGDTQGVNLFVNDTYVSTWGAFYDNGTITLHWTPTTAGTYTYKVCVDANVNHVLAQGTVKVVDPQYTLGTVSNVGNMYNGLLRPLKVNATITNLNTTTLSTIYGTFNDADITPVTANLAGNATASYDISFDAPATAGNYELKLYADEAKTVEIGTSTITVNQVPWTVKGISYYGGSQYTGSNSLYIHMSYVGNGGYLSTWYNGVMFGSGIYSSSTDDANNLLSTVPLTAGEHDFTVCLNTTSDDPIWQGTFTVLPTYTVNSVIYNKEVQADVPVMATINYTKHSDAGMKSIDVYYNGTAHNYTCNVGTTALNINYTPTSADDVITIREAGAQYETTEEGELIWDGTGAKVIPYTAVASVIGSLTPGAENTLHATITNNASTPLTTVYLHVGDEVTAESVEIAAGESGTYDFTFSASESVALCLSATGNTDDAFFNTTVSIAEKNITVTDVDVTGMKMTKRWNYVKFLATNNSDSDLNICVDVAGSTVWNKNSGENQWAISPRVIPAHSTRKVVASFHKSDVGNYAVSIHEGTNNSGTTLYDCGTVSITQAPAIPGFGLSFENVSEGLLPGSVTNADGEVVYVGDVYKCQIKCTNNNSTAYNDEVIVQRIAGSSSSATDQQDGYYFSKYVEIPSGSSVVIDAEFPIDHDHTYYSTLVRYRNKDDATQCDGSWNVTGNQRIYKASDISGTFTIPAQRYMTTCIDYPFVVPTGLTAITVTENAEGTLVYSKYAEGTLIPAGVGVILHGEVGDYTYTGANAEDVTSDVSAAFNEEYLKGTRTALTADEMGSASDGYKYYRLSAQKADDGTWTKNVGFYWGAANGAPFSLAAGKAYLRVSSALAGTSRFISLDDSDVTAIDLIETIDAATDADAVRYNLFGQRVGNDYKGIVVVKGKKFLNK